MVLEDKKMPRRKKHRNSKLGCATCKRRRVKCFEDLPACTNCVKHRVHCEYLDYSEKQLEEFHKAKRAQASEVTYDEKDDLKTEEVEGLEGLKLGTLETDGTDEGGHEALETAPGTIFQNKILHLPMPEKIELGDIDVLLNIAFAHEPRAPGGVLDVLNFRHNAITQNFDNLLATNESQIIYPVYQIHNTPDDEGSVVSTPLETRPKGPFAAARDVFASPHMLVHLVRTPFTAALAPQFPRALPHAVQLRHRFVVTKRASIDFNALLLQTTRSMAAEISQGKASLPQIRHLYHVWIGYFICKAYSLGVLFACLINLTTNYLITNVFSADSQSFDTLVLVTKVRNTLVVHSIQHYATVIKGLRVMLNRTGDPETAASVSYILLLMSIYDPEATAHSTKCFRDGMFSVLSYTLNMARRNGVAPPRLIPIHLQLMTNVVRTVYLPAYPADFLAEFETMLARLGSILQLTDAANPVAIYLHRKYSELWQFAQETLKSHIPAVNSHLSDIEFQEDIFFHMFRKWATLQPARFLVARECTDPVEIVLNLFYRAFRKGVFAVVPQVRFFFLRDFDSPLMLEVFAQNNDAEVFLEIDNAANVCMSPQAYAQIRPQLKLLAAYAIRLITFFSLRLRVLYRQLVYHPNVRMQYPINNEVEWRNSITDIGATRDSFHQRIGLLEYPVHTFMDTYITQLHYPQIVDPSTPGARLGTPCPPDNDMDGEVDLMSLQRYGLLLKDALPPPDE